MRRFLQWLIGRDHSRDEDISGAKRQQQQIIQSSQARLQRAQNVQSEAIEDFKESSRTLRENLEKTLERMHRLKEEDTRK